MIGAAISRISAVKRIAAQSRWTNLDRITRLHESVVASIWKYGAIAYVGAKEQQWQKLKKLHARCIKSYCGLSNYISYETVCDHLNVKPIMTDLFDFARKRLIAILSFSPLGLGVIQSHTVSNSCFYTSPIDALMTRFEFKSFRSSPNHMI